VNNVAVTATPIDKSDITQLGSPDQFAEKLGFLFGKQAFQGAWREHLPPPPPPCHCSASQLVAFQHTSNTVAVTVQQLPPRPHVAATYVLCQRPGHDLENLHT
jgi:hypothetical protein